MIASIHELLKLFQVVNFNRFALVNFNRSQVVSLNRSEVVNFTGFCKFVVDGKIRCRKLRVDLDTWADMVFEPTYELMSLTELSKFSGTQMCFRWMLQTIIKHNQIGRLP